MKVSQDLWASPIELALAARFLDVPIALKVNGSLITQGSAPAYMIVLKNKHYTLHAIHKYVRHKTGKIQGRGGMQDAWTWEEATPRSSQMCSNKCILG